MVVNILYQILAFPRNTPKNTNCEFIYVKMNLLICLIICIYLYTFEVYIFKISGLKLHKVTKLLIPKPGTRINKHPVF